MLSEEQAIEKLKKIKEDTIKANECGLSNNDFKEEIEVYDTVLNLMDRLQKESEEKDKQIDLMAYTLQDNLYLTPLDGLNKEELKQYFETKAKKGE